MRAAWLALAALLTALAPPARGQAGPAANAVIVTDFSNPGLAPSHWVLTLHRDGNGHFDSERGDPPPGRVPEMDAPGVNREIHLSAEFAEHVFQVAQRHNWFNEDCESHLKVAFQGWKKLSYSGPDGHGSCIFNYSRDKEMQELGDSLVGVAETLLEGARLEMLLQHDPLGLDKEMEYITDAVKDARLRQIGAIREILERLANDPEVLDRVRKRARALLAHPGA